jgi:hypothetical protein
MKIPGFTAEKSLYRRSKHYDGATEVDLRIGEGAGLKSNSVIPARRITCVCDDQGCCCAPIGRRCTYHTF